MDEQKLKSAGIDYDTALGRFVGNQMLYEKFLKKYIEDTHVKEAQKAYETGDYQEMLEAVHALKGEAGMLGMDALYQISAGMVIALRNHSYENLDKQLERLTEEHERMLQLLCEL